MLPLSERHADRAKRKAENALESESVKGQDHLTDVVAQVAAAQESLAGLSEDDRREVMARLDNAGEPSEGYTPTDPGSRPYAGIGVVNPFEQPVVQSGNGAGMGQNISTDQIADAAAEVQQRAAAEGWGAPNGGNLNGAAVDAAGGQGEGGQGEGGTGGNAGDADETLNADGKPKTAKELKAILDERKVTYETDANVPALQALVKANPAPAS